MALSKLCSRCQCVIPYTEKLCDKCKDIIGTHRSVRDKLYYESRKDKEYQAIYRSPYWKRIRQRVIVRANGLCEVCMRSGRIKTGDDVHHIIPIKINKSKAYDEANLIYLCRSCHIEAHKELDREDKKGRGVLKKF